MTPVSSFYCSHTELGSIIKCIESWRSKLSIRPFSDSYLSGLPDSFANGGNFFRLIQTFVSSDKASLKYSTRGSIPMHCISLSTVVAPYCTRISVTDESRSNIIILGQNKIVTVLSNLIVFLPYVVGKRYDVDEGSCYNYVRQTFTAHRVRRGCLRFT